MGNAVFSARRQGRHIAVLLMALNISACNTSTTGGAVTAASPLGTDFTRSGSQATSPYSLKDQADGLLARGQAEAALPIYRHLVTVDDRPDHVSGLAEALLSMGRADDAARLLADYSPVRDAHLHEVRGEALLATGDFRAALQAFDTALMLGAGEPALTGRGIAYTALGETDLAIDDFRKVSPPVGPSNEALVMVIAGRHSEAVALLETLVANDQAGPRDRQNLVFAYIAVGRDDDARRLAHIDLDQTTAHQTIGYYRMLTTLTPQQRIDTLMLGVAQPATNREEAANYQLAEIGSDTQQRAAVASARMLAERSTIMLAEATLPESASVPVVMINGEDLSDLDPTIIPPVLEKDGWAVQIGAYRSIRRLTRGWQQLMQDNSDILVDIPPRRSEIRYDERTNTGKYGFYYRLNAGPLKSLETATALCAQLTERGTACWVRPPSDSEKTPAPMGQLTAQAR